MTQDSEATSRAAIERDTLRLLCSVLIEPGTRMEICRLLQPGAFLDGLRSVVFEEISALGPLPSRKLRQLLPAHVTNRGFPDFNLDELLAPKVANEQQIEQLFESALQLLNLGGHGDTMPLNFGTDARE